MISPLIHNSWLGFQSTHGAPMAVGAAVGLTGQLESPLASRGQAPPRGAATRRTQQAGSRPGAPASLRKRTAANGAHSRTAPSALNSAAATATAAAAVHSASWRCGVASRAAPHDASAPFLSVWSVTKVGPPRPAGVRYSTVDMIGCRGSPPRPSSSAVAHATGPGSGSGRSRRRQRWHQRWRRHQ